MKQLLVNFLAGIVGVFLGYFALGQFFGDLTDESFYAGSDEFGNWGTWVASVSTFLTLMLLIIQNKKLSVRQDRLDTQQTTSKANETIEKYNALIFILNQHLIDKSNEFTTIYRLIENMYKEDKVTNALVVWKQMFAENRHVTNNVVFTSAIQQNLQNLSAKELYQIFHYLSLSKQEVTAKLEISLDLAVFSQKILTSPDFEYNAKAGDKRLINECIGNFCRELHSHNGRKLLNHQIDNLLGVESEFDKQYSIYNACIANFLDKKNARKEMQNISLVAVSTVIIKYFTQLELLAKEIVLLEESIIRIENAYGNFLYGKSTELEGCHSVILKKIQKQKTLESLSSTEVILFELYT